MAVMPRYWPVVVVYFFHSRLKQLAQARAKIKTSLSLVFQPAFFSLVSFWPGFQFVWLVFS